MNSKGLTLLEVLAVISILSVILLIGSVSVAKVIESSSMKTCLANLLTVERSYEREMEVNGVNHSDVHFTEILNSFDGVICSEGGYISYIDEHVIYSIHSESEDRGDVPFL